MSVSLNRLVKKISHDIRHSAVYSKRFGSLILIHVHDIYLVLAGAVDIACSQIHLILLLHTRIPIPIPSSAGSILTLKNHELILRQKNQFLVLNLFFL